MRATIVGPYPRVGSKVGDQLRKEREQSTSDTCDLRRELTKEVVHELVAAGITLPNTGLIDVHDEISWPLEHAEGVAFGGIKKIFHTNMLHREIIVNDELRLRTPDTTLYTTALATHPSIKIELPGPYTLTAHSLFGEKSPYKNREELTHAYAGFLRQYLSAFSTPALIHFNEPSIIAQPSSHDLSFLRDVYAHLLDNLNLPTAVWTYYGTYTDKTLDLLLSLPVDVVGFDFVADQTICRRLKQRSPDKGIGIGIIDSGDRATLTMEDKNLVTLIIKQMRDDIDLERSLVSSNATLEHLDRDYARKKITLLGDVCCEVNQ